jgi:hypothetical protein
MLKCLQTLLSLALCQGDKTSLPKLMWFHLIGPKLTQW